MIALLLVGFSALVVLAVIVGVVDAARAADRRFVASERRLAWERRQQHRHASATASSWDDEDD
ncbi:hypothetical protein [Pseudonocardia sp. N23]|uniref:hypothetical protein n=1 Tax=Pseudonocardia sp. N23 TaxID=1987376 RepID=UPI000C025B7B|nr:hypothetical protein [Pseudonocardia sp. N23]GAY09345.1 hypothetical protein TOK_3304 [Pseudonocardia sp. N23]